MRIKEQKELYFIIKKLGIEKTTELLKSYLHDEDHEIWFEDEHSIVYIAFSGYINKAEYTDYDAAISGFIEMNLQKGRKLFEKNIDKDKQREILKQAEEETKKHFNIKDEENNKGLTDEEIENMRRRIESSGDLDEIDELKMRMELRAYFKSRKF